MKRTIVILLAVVLLVGALPGCAREKTADVYTADNEIFTYQRIDPEKTQIAVSRTGNIEVQRLCSKFCEINPDVQVIYLDITGGNSNYKPLEDWLTKGFRPDVVISASSFIGDDLSTEYLECFSSDPVIQNYEADALQRTATAGDIYMLPGPSDVSAMMYNKTLFEQYGWQVPATFDEFVTLCDRIREDTNGEVEPWNPNAKYSNELNTALEAFTYAELFGGSDNRAWYNDFTDGNETFAGHMEPFFEMVGTLTEHGILREEHFSYSATTRGNEFSDGKIAMINVKIYNADNEMYDFGFMPFPTTSGELGYVCDSYSCFVGVPKKERTEKQQDAVRRFIEYFSSVEGQQTYIAGTMKVSNVKNVSLDTSEDLNSLSPAVNAGHMFDMLDFLSSDGLSSNISLHTLAKEIVTGEKTPAECIEQVDSAPYYVANDENAENPVEVIVEAADMTVLETSFYIADLYRETADADIGLIANNEAYRGNLMRIFSGAVTPDVVTVLKPRSFENNSTLIKARMSGAQLLAALSDPVCGSDKASECVYAYSGLKCELAPWGEPGAKYLSVTLEDGSELEADKLYTVAFWSGTVKDEYISGTPEAYEGTWEELMTAKLRRDGAIAPADDGRVSLVWD